MSDRTNGFILITMLICALLSLVYFTYTILKDYKFKSKEQKLQELREEVLELYFEAYGSNRKEYLYYKDIVENHSKKELKNAKKKLLCLLKNDFSELKRSQKV